MPNNLNMLKTKLLGTFIVVINLLNTCIIKLDQNWTAIGSIIVKMCTLSFFYKKFFIRNVGKMNFKFKKFGLQFSQN